MARPTINDEQAADRLLESAVDLLAAGGLDGLTLRAVAAQAGTSVTAVYTLFGGRSQLIAAAVQRAAQSLNGGLRRVGTSPDPVQTLRELGLAYLAWAREHPQLYGVLFGGAIRSTPTADAATEDPAGPLMAAIGRAVDSGYLAGPPEIIAATMWAGLHGLARLHADGAIDGVTARRVAPELVRTLVDGWRSALG